MCFTKKSLTTVSKYEKRTLATSYALLAQLDRATAF